MTTPHPHGHHRTSQILSLALHLSTPEEFTKEYTDLLSSSCSCSASNSGSPCSLNCDTVTTQSSYSLKESQTEREEVKRSKEIKETVQRAQTTAEIIRYVVGLTTRSELVCRLGGIRHRRYQVERNGECNGDTLVECLDVDVEATEANQSETEKERVMEMEMVQENLVKFGKLLGYTMGFSSSRSSCSPSLSSCDIGTFPLNTTPAKQTPPHSKPSSQSPSPSPSPSLRGLRKTQVQPQTLEKGRSRFDTPEQDVVFNDDHGFSRWLDQNQLDMSSNRVDEVEQIEYSLYHHPNDDDRRQGDVDSDLYGYGSRAREHTDGEGLKYEEYREMVNGPYQNMGGSETGEIERYGDVKFEDGYEYHSHSNCTIQQKLPLFNESYQPQRPSPPSVSPFFKESLKTRKPSYSLLNRKTSFPRHTRTKNIKSPRPIPRYLNPTEQQNPHQLTDEYSQSYSHSDSTRFLENQVTPAKPIQSPPFLTSPNLISDSPFLIQTSKISKTSKTHHPEFQASILLPAYSPSLAFTLSQPQFQSQSQFQAENDFQRQIQKDQNETTKKRPRRGSTQSTIPLPSSPLLNSTIDHDSPELDLCMQYQNEREGERDGEGECGVRGM